MPLGLADDLALAIRDALREGGDGRNKILYSEDFSNAVWLDNRGSGSISITKAPGYKPGTNRGARVTDNGSFDLYQLVGADGDFANKTVTFSAWVKPISGCTNLGIEVRNEAVGYSVQDKHPTPTVAKWKKLSATVEFGAIDDKAMVIFHNDDPNAPGAVFDVQEPQLEVSSTATTYQPTTDGDAPLQDLLDAIEAEYADGIELPAPHQWLMGESASIASVPSWPCGFILIDGGSLDPFGMGSIGSGAVIGTYDVTIGVMVKGVPAAPGAMRRKLHRYLRAVLERLIDAEIGNELGGATIGAGPVRTEFRSGIATENEMFADASMTLTFGTQETR